MNLDYEDLIATYQLVLGWLLNTMSVEIALQMEYHTTSFELWKAAKELAGEQTRSRITLLRSELQRTRKGNLKMEDCLNKMKNILDKSFTCSKPHYIE